MNIILRVQRGSQQEVFNSAKEVLHRSELTEYIRRVCHYWLLLLFVLCLGGFIGQAGLARVPTPTRHALVLTRLVQVTRGCRR